jgi:hypothetical protein
MQETGELWTRLAHPPPSADWAFLAAFVGIGISLWRLPRTAFGFAAGVSVTFLLFFSFNKQAFCNYYYFVIGALAVAVAALPEPSPSAGNRLRRN